eukprot:scaffold160474_cov37-Tisochrysis_lutea.AAC.2
MAKAMLVKYEYVCARSQGRLHHHHVARTVELPTRVGIHQCTHLPFISTTHRAKEHTTSDNAVVVTPCGEVKGAYHDAPQMLAVVHPKLSVAELTEQRRLPLFLEDQFARERLISSVHFAPAGWQGTVDGVTSWYTTAVGVRQPPASTSRKTY